MYRAFLDIVHAPGIYDCNIAPNPGRLVLPPGMDLDLFRELCVMYPEALAYRQVEFHRIVFLKTFARVLGTRCTSTHYYYKFNFVIQQCQVSGTTESLGAAAVLGIRI